MPPATGRQAFNLWNLAFNLQQVRELREDVSPLSRLDPIRVDVIDCLDSAESHTLGVAIAVIAFHTHPIDGVEKGMSERARNDARLTSDTFVFVDDHPLIFNIPMAGLRGTDLDTERLLTILTGHWEIESHVLPFHHLDPGTAGITRPIVKD